MSNVKPNQPIRSINNTKFNITIGGQTTEMDFGFSFSAGEILFKENKICLFQDDYELNQPLLGKMFDLKGKLICDIPFPKSPYPSHVKIVFHWCAYHEGDIHLDFGTDNTSNPDFGIRYYISNNTFGSPHPTR